MTNINSQMRHFVGKSAQGYFAGKSDTSDKATSYFTPIANTLKFSQINNLNYAKLKDYLSMVKRLDLAFVDVVDNQVNELMDELKEIHQATDQTTVKDKMEACYNKYVKNESNPFSKIAGVRALIYIVFMEKVEPIRHEFLGGLRNKKFENLNEHLNKFFTDNVTDNVTNNVPDRLAELMKAIQDANEAVVRSQEETQALISQHPAANILNTMFLNAK